MFILAGPKFEDSKFCTAIWADNAPFLLLLGFKKRISELAALFSLFSLVLLVYHDRPD